MTPAEFGDLYSRFMTEMLAQSGQKESPLLERMRDHLGGDPARLPVIAEEFDPFEHPNLQRALDAYIAKRDHRADLIGIGADNKRFMGFSISDLMSRAGQRVSLAEGPVDYVNFHLAGDEVLPCVQFGVYLVTASKARLIAFVSGPTDQGGPRRRLRLEVMSARRADCEGFLEEIAAGMREHNVYRGHVISLSSGQMGMGPQTLVEFHQLPEVRREQVVLPARILNRVERHTVTFAEHGAELLAAGRSLKRGLLLYGLPGTGKTLTVMYLSSRMPGRTVLLTTGRGMGMLQAVCQMARKLAPAMVVMEDVDLIAEERGQPFQRTGPLLFELLNELDGLRDDTDVIFVLTTNRPDILEPALAARPGRIDLAVELPLPDADGRRRLLELYGRGLDLKGTDVEPMVDGTAGVSPAYIKELLRKAALIAAEAGAGTRVSGEHLRAAKDDLAEGGRLAERILGYRPEPGGGGGIGPPGPLPPTGFPPVAWTTRIDPQP